LKKTARKWRRWAVLADVFGHPLGLSPEFKSYLLVFLFEVRREPFLGFSLGYFETFAM
jgi:hypothetical protein